MPADDTAPTFWRRRVLKIYPNHLVTFVAAVLILTLVAKEAVQSWVALPNVLLVHSFFPQLEVRGSVNGVAWTLSCEALFYFSFPFLMRLIGRIRPDRLWLWADGVVAAIFAVPLVATFAGPAQVPFPLGLTEWETFFVYQFPPFRMLEFVFGIMLARIVMTGQRVPLGLGGSVVLTFAAFAVTPGGSGHLRDGRGHGGSAGPGHRRRRGGGRPEKVDLNRQSRHGLAG